MRHHSVAGLAALPCSRKFSLNDALYQATTMANTARTTVAIAVMSAMPKKVMGAGHALPPRRQAFATASYDHRGSGWLLRVIQGAVVGADRTETAAKQCPDAGVDLQTHRVVRAPAFCMPCSRVLSTMSCWVRLLQFKAALMSGDV